MASHLAQRAVARELRERRARARRIAELEARLRHHQWLAERRAVQRILEGTSGPEFDYLRAYEAEAIERERQARLEAQGPFRRWLGRAREALRPSP